MVGDHQNLKGARRPAALTSTKLEVLARGGGGETVPDVKADVVIGGGGGGGGW